MARLFLTGGRGFVGRYLAEAAAPDHELALLEGDIRDADLGAQIATFAPDAVIHLAAIASPRDAERDARLAFAVNLDGTFRLAEAVRAAAPGAIFVFASSATVYGASFSNRAAPIAETVPLAPNSLYGATKAGAEMALSYLSARGLNAIVLRAFNHTGPGQSPDYVLSSWCRQAVRIERGLQPARIVAGNVDLRRDIFDVRDAARAYLAAALAGRRAAGAICNLASGWARPLSHFLELIAAATGLDFEIDSQPSLRRDGEPELISGDPARIRALLGWQAEIAPEQTIADLIAWWRAADPDSLA